QQSMQSGPLAALFRGFFDAAASDDLNGTVQVKAAYARRDEVDERAHALGQLPAAEVAQVMSPVIRRMRLQAGNERAFAKRRADLVGGQLRQTVPIHDCAHDEVVVVEHHAAVRDKRLRLSLHLEIPGPEPPACKPAVY